MIRIWFFASMKCPPLRFSCFFSIFSNLFACRALSFLISELFISTPCCHVFLQISFPFLFFGYSYCFIIICRLQWFTVVNCAGWLLQITLFAIASSLKGTVIETQCISSRCPIFMTVVSVSELTGLILVTDANPGLGSIKRIVKFNVSATACITTVSAPVP